MRFTPDIVVTVPDAPGVSLVVETKRDGVLDEVEHQLKSYMLQMDCPVGLIVTPKDSRIYKNRFLGRSEESIQLVADFPTRELFGANVQTESLLESELLHWLEKLASTGQTSIRNPRLSTVISEYILPAVSGGLVSFAHPDSA